MPEENFDKYIWLSFLTSSVAVVSYIFVIGIFIIFFFLDRELLENTRFFYFLFILAVLFILGESYAKWIFNKLNIENTSHLNDSLLLYKKHSEKINSK